MSDAQRSPNVTAGADIPAVPGYEILGLLGEGGMGRVYKAHHTGLNRAVALKTLLMERSLSAEQLGDAVSRFRREAEALALARHPNVVEIYDFGQVGGRPYMVMELLPGGSLQSQLSARGRFAPTVAAELVATLADGIAAAHRQGLVHRDLKPQNVLFTQAGTPKITDFGLVRLVGRDQTQLTRQDQILGTVSYMAPEQAVSEPTGH